MNRPRVSILIAVLIPLGVAIFWLVNTSRAATETPDYQVVRADGKFEIRDYPTLMTARTPMASGGMNGGFGQLFQFITGSNETEQKIEMTAPVLIETTNDQKTMSFIMPKATVEKGVPKPKGDDVTLGKVEAARFAVFRFSGGRTSENEVNAVKELRKWLEREKPDTDGEPMFAYYDPPWTPTFMRRNEVMIRLKPPLK